MNSLTFTYIGDLTNFGTYNFDLKCIWESNGEEISTQTLSFTIVEPPVEIVEEIDEEEEVEIERTIEVIEWESEPIMFFELSLG